MEIRLVFFYFQERGIILYKYEKIQQEKQKYLCHNPVRYSQKTFKQVKL